MAWAQEYVLGIVVAVLIFLCTRQVKKPLSEEHDGRARQGLYRADHGVLNIPLPPQSMWMNHGYWKVQ